MKSLLLSHTNVQASFLWGRKMGDPQIDMQLFRYDLNRNQSITVMDTLHIGDIAIF